RLLISQFAQGTLAVGPALAYLDVDIQVHLLVQQLDHVLPRLGCNALHVYAARAKQDGTVRFALDHHAGGYPDAGVVLFPLFDDHGAAVRQFVAHQAEYLFPDKLGHDKAHGPVGQRVFFEHGLAFGQARADFAQQVVQLHAAQGADGHDGGVGELRHDLVAVGEHVVLAFYGIDLVDHQYRVAGLGQQGQQLRIARRPLARLDHMDHLVDIGQRLRDHAIHHAVHGTAVPRLESRRIDKNELFMLARQHAMYAVPSGLGLARHNGNLAAYQRIGQRGFAHIGAPDDGDKAATKGICHLFSWETATGRESCVDFR